MMKGVVARGTAKLRARTLGRPAAGKTGTTANYRDVWFTGFTTDLLACVWIGRDDSTPIGDKITGGGVAVPIWVDFMQKAHPRTKVRDFPVPPERHVRARRAVERRSRRPVSRRGVDAVRARHAAVEASSSGPTIRSFDDLVPAPSPPPLAANVRRSRACSHSNRARCRARVRVARMLRRCLVSAVLVTLACSGLGGCRKSLEDEPDADSSGARACKPATTAECTMAETQSSLAWIETNVFAKSCAFSGCHNGTATVAGRIDLKTPGASHDDLVGIDSVVEPGRKLVVPGARTRATCS